MTEHDDNKKSQDLFSKNELYSDAVRVPINLFVDDIELDPPNVTVSIVRTAYDLTFNPEEIQKLFDWLGKKISENPYKPVKIRVIGKLES